MRALFYSVEGAVKLKDLAETACCRLIGNGETEISGAAPVEGAGPGTVTLLYMKRYLRNAMDSGASAILTTDEFFPKLEGRNLLVSDEPAAAFARVLAVFASADRRPSGISPRASVSPDASLGAGVTIMDFSYVGPGASIGRGTVVYPNAYIGGDASVGEDCIIYSGAAVRDRCLVGNRCVLHPGAVIGADGFGFSTDGDGHHKIPQIGRAVLEDDVEIGANSCVDRGTVGDTIVGRGSKLDNLVMVGHNVKIGEHSLLVAQTGIAGSTRVGSWCMFGGQAGISGHLEIGNGVRIGAKAGVMSHLDDGAVVAGYPATDKNKWLRQAAALERVEQVLRELRLKKKDQS
jgi:UDP-3-O-[3-hydroxymyristoyl] glucosamine N-acyltransferase